MNEDSGELVERASRGDVTAVDALLVRFVPKVQAFIRLQAGDMIRAQESVSDLVQSVCREVLGDLDNFSYQGEAKFLQWLFTTAKRKIIDRDRYYRAKKRDVGRQVRQQPRSTSTADEKELLDGYANLFTPSKDAMVHEEMELFDQAFRKLPEHYQEIITLARIYGYSNDEIAQKLNKSEGSVRMLLGRALARLSTLLKTERGSG